ncbi:MAG TPA: hypothetical protein VMU85_06925 [Stellaceae bacterium]|nr:hypothetical protein [Stellaceae bacterium]
MAADARSFFIKDSPERIALYDRQWSGHIDAIASQRALGASMAEIVAGVDAAIRGYYGFIHESILVHIPKIELGRFADRPPPERLVVVNGHYQSLPAMPGMDGVFSAIAGVVDPEVDCIVEFGSGLGCNLARLRLRLPQAPVTYIACEPTEHGRRASELLFSADPDARFEARAFDYGVPDLGFLDRFRKIVAFTVHSIEQMPVLGEAFYGALLATNIAHCIHLEPVGWQRFTNLAQLVLSLHTDREAWQWLRQNFEFVVEDSELVNNSAMWSAAGGYNTDLLPLIAAAAGRGEVALTALAYETIGINPFNPSTLVAWRRTRAG